MRIQELEEFNQIPNKRQYDLLISTLGYEKRANFVAQQIQNQAKTKISIGFTRFQILNYDKNKNWYSSNDFNIYEIRDDEYLDTIKKVFKRLNHTAENIAVDISSLNRKRMAILVDFLKNRVGKNLNIDFYYNLAKFTEPPEANQIPNEFAGPVLDSFAGWSIDPEMPICAMVGLGFEEDKALGAVEYTQASKVWLFKPQSAIKKYSETVDKANQSLYDITPIEQIITYSIHKPLILVKILDDLIYKIVRENSIVLLPFGPKIFTLCSLLTASIYETTSVWRVSKGKNRKENHINDRIPSNYIMGLRAHFKGKNEKHFTTPIKNLLEAGYF